MIRSVRLRRSPSAERYFARQDQLDTIGPEQEPSRRVATDVLYRRLNETPRMEITVDSTTGAHMLSGQCLFRRDRSGLGASIRWICGMGQTRAFMGVDSTDGAAKWRSYQAASIQMMLILVSARQTVPLRGSYWLATRDFADSPGGVFLIQEMHSTLLQFIRASKRPMPFDLIENNRDNLRWQSGITTTTENIDDGVTIGALTMYVHYWLTVAYRPAVQHLPKAHQGRDSSGHVRTALDKRKLFRFVIFNSFLLF